MKHTHDNFTGFIDAAREEEMLKKVTDIIVNNIKEHMRFHDLLKKSFMQGFITMNGKQ